MRRGRVGAGRQRESVLVVAELSVDDGEVGCRLVAEDREAHLAAGGIPLDVEAGGVRRVRPVGEQVPPPAAGRRAGDADVVGHDVDDHAHARGVGGCRQPAQAIGSAARRIDGGVVDDVVAVLGSGLGGQDR